MVQKTHHVRTLKGRDAMMRQERVEFRQGLRVAKYQIGGPFRLLAAPIVFLLWNEPGGTSEFTGMGMDTP